MHRLVQLEPVLSDTPLVPPGATLGVLMRSDATQEPVIEPNEQPKEVSALRSCPDELIAEIFSYGVAGPDDYRAFEIIRINPERKIANFIVAAVCTRWRTIALAYAKLWHYVAVPNLQSEKIAFQIPRIVSYMSLALERSRDAPFDLVFEYLAEDGLADLKALEELLNTVGVHIQRLRRFSVVSDSGVIGPLLDLFRAPTPLLRTFELGYQNSPENPTHNIHTFGIELDDDDIPAAPPILTYTPMLRNIVLINVPIAWKLWAGRNTQPVFDIELVQFELPTNFWETLASQTKLDWLTIRSDNVDISSVLPPTTGQKIILPELRTLWVQDAANLVFARDADTLETPNLDRLIVISIDLSIMKRFMGNIGVSVSQLTISYVWIDGVGAEGLRALRHLERLQLVESVTELTCLLKPLLLQASLQPLQRDESHKLEQHVQFSDVVWPHLQLVEVFALRIAKHERVLFDRLASDRKEAGPLDTHGKPGWRAVELTFSGCLDLEEVVADGEIGDANDTDA